VRQQYYHIANYVTDIISVEFSVKNPCNCCQMSFSLSEHQNRCRLSLRPRPNSGSLQRCASQTYWLQTNCTICRYIHWSTFGQVTAKLTRKLCYRKDDRAMRPTCGCPENFRDSLTTPTATILNIFMGFCFDRPYMNVPTKFKVRIALPVLEIIGGTPKIWAVPGYAHAPFSPKFLMGFYLDRPCKYTRQI